MRLIILDTETTGLSPAEGRIVEIAAVEMLDGKLTGREFHQLLNPEHPISEEITEITGINDAMVAWQTHIFGYCPSLHRFRWQRQIGSSQRRI